MKKLLYLSLLMLCACGLQGHETLGIQGTPTEEVVPEEQVTIPARDPKLKPTSKLTMQEEQAVDRMMAELAIHLRVECVNGGDYTVYVVPTTGGLTDPRCYVQGALSTTLRPGVYVLDIRQNTLRPSTVTSH